MKYMESGRGGMGSHKHGVSGHSGKSPKLRLAMKMAAEKNERRRRRGGDMFDTVDDAVRGNRRKR